MVVALRPRPRRRRRGGGGGVGDDVDVRLVVRSVGRSVSHCCTKLQYLVCFGLVA